MLGGNINNSSHNSYYLLRGFWLAGAVLNRAHYIIHYS